MLNQLPPEVIVEISNFLTFREKLVLITTCRQIFNLISNTNLYSELVLVNRDKNLEEIIGKFSDSRHHGAQVKILYFPSTEMPDQLLFQLPTIFPNITRVISQSNEHDWMEVTDDGSNRSMINWSRTLKIYDMNEDWVRILPLLKTATFSRLRELVLVYYSSLSNRKEGYDTSYFIPYIKNAPMLEELVLNDCAIDLELLEEIHASCPYLKSLTLSRVSIVIRNDTLLQPIISADTLINLYIMGHFYFDAKGLFLDYITAKYRCLKVLQLHVKNTEYRMVDFSKYHQEFDPQMVVDNGVVDNIHTPQVQAYIRMYESLENEWQDTLHVYKQSGTRFFSNITPSIKSIYVSYDPFNTTIKALTTSHTKIANLTYHPIIKDPNQIQYIKQITSLKTLEINIKFPAQINLQVPSLTNITKLDISNSGQDFNLDCLLLVFPSLEDLRIRKGKWTVSGDSTPRIPSLRKFRASVHSLDQKCLDFLTRTAPNLKVIHLSSTWCGTATSDINMDISGLDLLKLNVQFHVLEFQGSFYYHIKAPYLDEVVRHNPSQHSVSLVEQNTHAKPPMFNLICDDNTQFTCFFPFWYMNGMTLIQKRLTLISTGIHTMGYTQ